VVPVAVLGTEDFDVSTIDPATLMLEGVPPIRWNTEDVASPYTGVDSCGCTTEGPDGFDDLTLKFKTQELVAALEPWTDREVRELTLTGMLQDGTPLIGTDCMLIIVPGQAPPAPVIALGSEPDQLRITWGRAEGPSFMQYAVYRGSEPTFYPDSPQDYVGISQEPEFVDTGINPEEIYYYRVAAVDEPVPMETASGPVVLDAYSSYSDVGSLNMTTDVSALGENPLVLSLASA
jgi:hypothetical protein